MLSDPRIAWQVLSFQDPESESNLISHSFKVNSLSNFVGDLEEGSLLYLVMALRMYLRKTEDISPHFWSLFVSQVSF